MGRDRTRTVFFYVQGSDLHEIAPLLRERFMTFLAGRKWSSPDVWFVEQIHDDDPTLGPGDLPDWDLGLNLSLATSRDERPLDWFDDVKAVIELLRVLSAETGRTFVVGASFELPDVGRDLAYVDAAEFDLDPLRCALDPS